MSYCHLPEEASTDSWSLPAIQSRMFHAEMVEQKCQGSHAGSFWVPLAPLHLPNCEPVT